MMYVVYELTEIMPNDREEATVYGLTEVDRFDDKQDAIACIERRKVYQDFTILEIY